MALNRFMHPRNRYKDKKPDFKALAVKYPEFRKNATQDIKGAVHIDFKKPECLRALSWALLKEDFDLDLEMPLDRLIPTIPLRLNYILWIEDLLSTTEKPSDAIGIDIGCGSSCVYPLLGSKKNGWKFLTSEADSTNYQYAKRNVERNLMQEKVEVVEVSDETGLLELITDRTETYDFAMCNPPFFGSNLEAWATYSSRNEDRPEPMSVCTASPKESVVPGGEVNFVKRMISDSLVLKDKVRIYTAMLGKKSSLAPLKAELQNQSIENFGTTEFSQGRTMRWGIGWSFDKSVKFPVPPTKLVKKKVKPVQPLVYVVPNKPVNPDSEYTVASIGSTVMEIMDEFKVVFEPEKSTSDIIVGQAVAQQNTWVHQRRKRRKEHQNSKPEDNKDHSQNDGETGGKNDVKSQKDQDTPSDDIDGPDAKRRLLDEDAVNINTGDTKKSEKPSKETENPQNVSIEDIEEYVLKFTLTLKKLEKDIRIELQWIDGESKELLHQIMQLFKNRLK